MNTGYTQLCRWVSRSWLNSRFVKLSSIRYMLCVCDRACAQRTMWRSFAFLLELFVCACMAVFVLDRANAFNVLWSELLCVCWNFERKEKCVCDVVRCAFIWCCRRRCQCRLSVWSLILTDTTAWIACWCVCFFSQQDGTFLCGFLILFLSLRISKLKPFLQIQNDTTSDEWICEQQINQHVV